MLQASVVKPKRVAKNVEILETDDYDIFKQLPHNRPLVKNHVRLIARSMMERPHLRPARPVLVNDKMQVIDGQHRLAASRVNGQTVYYMIVPRLDVEDARQLNALQRTWRILDYAYSYASSKVPAYVQFVEAYENYGLAPSVVLEIMMKNRSNSRQIHFRTGLLDQVEQNELDDKLGRVKEVIDAYPDVKHTYNLAMAMLTIMKLDDYDHERLVKKIQQVRPAIQPNRVAYLRELERVYNADIGISSPNYRRFF